MLRPESQPQSLPGGPQEQPWILCTAQNGVSVGAYLEFLSELLVIFAIRRISRVSFLPWLAAWLCLASSLSSTASISSQDASLADSPRVSASVSFWQSSGATLGTLNKMSPWLKDNYHELAEHLVYSLYLVLVSKLGWDCNMLVGRPAATQ